MAKTSDQFFDCLCRTCMHEVDESLFRANTSAEQSWQSIFDTIEECGALRIAELLSNTVPQIVEVQLNDELPKKICCKCLQQLLSLYRFQQTCVQSDKQMRKMLDKRNADSPIIEHSVEDGKSANDFPVQDFVLGTREHRIDFECVNSLQVAPPLSGTDPLKSTGEAIDSSTDFQLDVSGYVKTEMDNDGSNTDFSDGDDEPLLPTATVKDEVMTRETDMEKISFGSSELIDDKCKTSLDDPNVLKSQHKEKDDKKEIPVHSKIKADRFTCDICQRRFLKSESLEKHRLKHEAKANKTKSQACDQCDKTYNSPVTLANHKRLRHSTEQTQQNLYPCEFCDKVYKSAVTLKNHLQKHTGDRVLCPECGKSFSTEGNLRQHRLRHRDDKPFECPYCPLRFPCVSSVYNHKKIHEAKRHICDICGAAFAQPYEMKKHKRYHLGERKYKCDYCDMRFVRPDHQRRHMRTHTGEKPYKCKYCDRAYAQSNDHIKHLRTHLGDNVYRCELCPLAFRLCSEMRLHFTTHKNDDEETRARNLKALKEEEAKLGYALVAGIAVTSGDEYRRAEANM